MFFIHRLHAAEVSHQMIQQEKYQLESNLKNEIETAKVFVGGRVVYTRFVLHWRVSIRICVSTFIR